MEAKDRFLWDMDIVIAQIKDANYDEERGQNSMGWSGPWLLRKGIQKAKLQPPAYYAYKSFGSKKSG